MRKENYFFVVVVVDRTPAILVRVPIAVISPLL